MRRTRSIRRTPTATQATRDERGSCARAYARILTVLAPPRLGHTNPVTTFSFGSFGSDRQRGAGGRPTERVEENRRVDDVITGVEDHETNLDGLARNDRGVRLEPPGR